MQKEFKYIIISLGVSILVAVAKFIAYFATDSMAILSDALESIINVAAAVFAGYSVYLKAKPSDKNHPYGHGKVEFFSIGFEGAMISVAGLFILYKVVAYFLSPHEVVNIGDGLLIFAATGVVNGLLGWYLIRSGKKVSSITIKGNGLHILTDAWSSLGVIVVLLLMVWTGWPWLDPIASLFIGFLIITKGYKLIRKAVSGLMDETDEEIVREIIDVFSRNRKPGWVDMHNLRIQQFGSNLHVDCHVTLPYYLSLEQAHEEVEQIEKLLDDHFSDRHVECFIHMDPCSPPQSCPYCQLSTCVLREASFEKKVDWNIESVLSNHKHLKKR